MIDTKRARELAAEPTGSVERSVQVTVMLHVLADEVERMRDEIAELNIVEDNHRTLLEATKELEAVASTHQWMHDEIGANQLRKTLTKAREAITVCEEGG